MKIIVTHASPDWDAIASVWVIKKFLPGWQDAAVEFVPAGQRKAKCIGHSVESENDPIELIGKDEIIHVDTGMGPLDHHQTLDYSVCGASKSWDYVREQIEHNGTGLTDTHKESVSRIMQIIVALDHFQEVFWENAAADYHEFNLNGLLEGLKIEKPDEDDYYVEFGRYCLNALVHTFENRIWAENEITSNGKQFETRFGKGIAFETINDTVLKLAQKMGYILVVRKDPRKGYVRIKTGPERVNANGIERMANGENQGKSIDLTLAHEMLKKIDPEATWFLHVSKKMLLNGTPKNPTMIPTRLTLDEIIRVLENTYK